jgi:hypothetical protein
MRLTVPVFPAWHKDVSAFFAPRGHHHPAIATAKFDINPFDQGVTA